jgi:hypothetical protein
MGFEPAMTTGNTEQQAALSLCHRSKISIFFSAKLHRTFPAEP